MRCVRSVAKSECSQALAPGLCFAHGANINSRDESCGKLMASGLCAKSLAAESGQAEAVEIWSQIRLGSTKASIGIWLAVCIA
jgi:hypothetical protein